MLSRRHGIMAALALCVAPLVYFLPATLGEIVLCPDDGVLINLPLRAAVAGMIKDGILPLWDPYIFGGMPLLGASQAGVLFPPNWLFLILSPQAAINVEMILAYMVAGLGAFCYARRTGASVAGSFLTGFAFQFAGFIVAPTGHMGSIQAAALLPWILWSIDGYGMTGRRSRGAVIAILTALQLFAGHPQTFVYSMILAGVYAIVMAFRKAAVNRAYLYSIGMMIAGIALGAVQLLPTLELTQQSFRQAVDYEFFSSFSLPTSSLLSFFAPYLNGGADGRFFQLPYTGLPYYGEYIGYVGVVTLLLAISAPLVKRDRLTIFWCVVGLVCLTLALGRNLPFEIYRLVQYIPGLGLFRVPARHLMEVDLALAVLAGRSLTAIHSPNIRKTNELLYVGIGGFVATVSIVMAGAWTSSGPDSLLPTLRTAEFWCPLVTAGSTVVVMWLLARDSRRASAVAILLVIIDLSLWGQYSGWRSGPKVGNEVFAEPPVMTFLRQQQFDQPLSRVLTLFPPPDANYYTSPLQPDLYMLHDIQNAAGYDAFALQRYSNFTGGMKEWGELIDPSRNLADDKVFDLLNVRYLIAKRTPDGQIHSGTNSIGENALSGHWRVSAIFDDAAVYENTRPQPRAWLATRAVVMSDDNEMLKTIGSGKFADGQAWDITRTVLLAAPADLSDVGVEPGTAMVTNYVPDHISVKTDSATRSILVLAENYYPGWQATVDGHDERILQVNYYQRGVELPAGVHNVQFYYRPLPFRVGSIISVMTLFGLGLWWSMGRHSVADGDDG